MYVSIALRTFGVGLIAIFIPIYLYKLGFSLSDILSYFLIDYAAAIFISILAGYFSSRIGAKRIIALSGLLTLLSFFMLYNIIIYNIPIWLIAVVSSFAATFFWTAYHDDFSKIKEKKEDGKEVGTMVAISKFAALLGPFAGGALATFVDIKFTFILASIIVIASTVPLFLTKEVTVKRAMKLKNLDLRKIKNDLFSSGAASIEPATFYIVWPLLSFLFLSEYLYVGTVTSFASLLTVFVIIKLGRKIDREGKGQYIMRGSIYNAIQNIYKIFVGSALTIFSAT